MSNIPHWFKSGTLVTLVLLSGKHKGMRVHGNIRSTNGERGEVRYLDAQGNRRITWRFFGTLTPDPS